MRWIALSTALILAGCAKDDEVMDPEIVDFTVDPTEITAGTDATVMVDVAHFAFTEHHDMSTMGADGDHASSAVQKGHVHVYLDDLETNPLVMMMSDMDTLTIPDNTEAGAHTLIARLHDDGHLIIEPEVTAEVEITVLAP